MTEVKIGRRIQLWVGFAALACGLLLFVAGSASAYEQYHPSDTTSVGDGCYQCHGWDNDANPAWVATSLDGFRNDGFDGRGPLHDMHVRITGTCDLCHINSGDVPYTYQSGDPAGEGCRGCHGRDPGGPPNFNWGAGVRLHHANAGAPADQDGDVCADCHDNDPVPLGEDTVPLYYLRVDVDAKDPCNADATEDWGGVFGEPYNVPDGIGMDNDGDLLYDAADLIDCPEPGETLMLGIGIGVLLLAGRWRTRR